MAGAPKREYKNGFVRWVEYRLPIFSATDAIVGRDYPSPGVYPDWWKLPLPDGSGAWTDITRVIEGRDPYCRGVLLLGDAVSLEQLEQAFETARRQPVCKGFAVGRAIFGDAAEAWFSGRLDDADAVSVMAENYGRLVATWQRARAA